MFEQDGVGVAVRGCQMSACRLGRDWHGLGKGVLLGDNGEGAQFHDGRVVLVIEGS